jgi:hypothetical protein
MCGLCSLIFPIKHSSIGVVRYFCFSNMFLFVPFLGGFAPSKELGEIRFNVYIKMFFVFPRFCQVLGAGLYMNLINLIGIY